MHRGWVKIHRRVFDNPYWQEKPFTRGQAWVDIIMLANHQEGHIRKRGVKVKIERGQLGHSQNTLAERWGWSRGKVIRFLSELEIAQQIVQQKNNVTSLITVVNYNEYQGDGTADSTASSTADGPQTVQQTVQEQEVKNKKKVKKKSNGKFVKPSLEEVVKYCQERGKGVIPKKWFNHYTSNGWKVGKNKMVDWRAAVRTWETEEKSKWR